MGEIKTYKRDNYFVSEIDGLSAIGKTEVESQVNLNKLLCDITEEMLKTEPSPIKIIKK